MPDAFRSRSDVSPTYTIHPRQEDGELASYRIALRRASSTLWRGCVRWPDGEASPSSRSVQVVEAYADTLHEAVLSVRLAIDILRRDRQTSTP